MWLCDLVEKGKPSSVDTEIGDLVRLLIYTR
jgi:hypothetical protein